MVSEVMTVNSAVDTKSRDGSKTFVRVNNRFNVFDDLGVWFKSNLGKTVRIDITMNGKYENVRETGSVISEGQPLDMQVAQKIAEVGFEFDKKVESYAKPKIVAENAPMKLNSRAWGVGADSIKIYFDTYEELDTQVSDLHERGYMPAAYYDAMDKAKARANPQTTKEIEKVWDKDKQVDFSKKLE